MYNEYNFFRATKATFKGCKEPKREPDYVSNSGSEYWYTPKGVIRSSNHWSAIRPFAFKSILDGRWYNGYRKQCGKIASCHWVLKSNTTDWCGFCPWDKFRKN